MDATSATARVATRARGIGVRNAARPGVPARAHRATRRARRDAPARASERADDERTAGPDSLRTRARTAVDAANAALGTGSAARSRESAAGRRRSSEPARVEANDGVEYDVKLIVTDVDGTLLDSKQRLSERTAAALREAAELGVRTVVATGKTRGPWARKLYDELGRDNKKMPGLFIQGLITCDGLGKTIKSRTLDKAYVKDILRFAQARDCTIVAFCDTKIVCSTRNELTDKVLDYGEPEPVECGDLLAKSDEYDVNKLLLFCDDADVQRYRLEVRGSSLSDACDVTVAVSGMLEFLPKGASKGAAVRELCESLEIDLANVLALGDGENDKEMLTYAGVGVAVGNASDATKAVADIVLDETNDDDAVAVAIERYVLPVLRREAKAKAEAEAEAKRKLKEEAKAKATAKVQAAKEKAEYQVLLRQKTEDERREAEAELEAELELKVETEEKLLGLVRAVAQGTQRVSEALTPQEIEANEARDAASTTSSSVESETTTDERQAQLDAIEALAAKQSQELIERQRANQERLKRLQLEYEAAKAELAKVEKKSTAKMAAKVVKVDDRATSTDAEEDEKERIRSETNIIKARTSLKKAAQKAKSDARKSEKEARVQEKRQVEETGVTTKDAVNGANLFAGFVASALKTVATLGGAEVLRRRQEADRDASKARLLLELVDVDGGRECSPDTLERINEAIATLEALNPTKKGAKSTLMLGLWSCAFTNCPQILGTEGINMMKQKGATTFFSYDLDTERCEIDRGWPLRRLRASVSYRTDSSFELDIPLAPISKVFGISLSNEERNYSALTVTYLDPDMQICRGRDDTVYVFVQNDPTHRLDLIGD